MRCLHQCTNTRKCRPRCTRTHTRAHMCTLLKMARTSSGINCSSWSRADAPPEFCGWKRKSYQSKLGVEKSETYNSLYSSNHNSYCQANIKEPFCTHAHTHISTHTHMHTHTHAHTFIWQSIKSNGSTKKLYQVFMLISRINFLSLFWEQSEEEVDFIRHTKPKTPFQPITDSHNAPGHLTRPRRCCKQQNYQPLLGRNPDIRPASNYSQIVCTFTARVTDLSQVCQG